MQALLSYDQSPPLAAPFRFFLTAPVFGILAGLLLLASGPDLFASRWTPAALALTHLMTAGFMLQVMLGALLQILPVVAGANVERPLRVASAVHLTITIGTLLLVAAFLSFAPLLFNLAALLLGVGVLVFVGAAVRALSGVASTGYTIAGLKWSLVGLAVTVGIGVLLCLALGFSLNVPLLTLADVHLGWGFFAWATVLLAAVGYVVVPMFQITPAYPEWFARFFAGTLVLLVVLWSLAELAASVADSALAATGMARAALLLGALLVALAALFALVTLAIQRRSRRARFDATQHLWRGAMLSMLAAGLLWLAAMSVPRIGEWPGWPVLCGVLLVFGGFSSVIVGMLYKIVPFLIWLDLQNRGQRRLIAPNMKKIIAERAMGGQMLAHFAAAILVVFAALWPELLSYPAGLALIVSHAWLLRNLLAALSVYRAHGAKIDSLFAGEHAQ